MADQMSSRPARTADGVRRAHSLRSTTWAMDSPLARQAPSRSAPVRNGCGRPAGATASSPFHPGHRPRAAADRVIDALRQRSALPVDGQEPHAIGMRAGLDRAQQAAEIEQMRHFLEIDDVGPGERQAQPLADPRQARLDLVRVDAVGQAAFQAQHHGLVGAVPLAGRAQRAVQLDPHAAHGGQRAVRARRAAKRLAAIIGPTVCELEGPMPILNRSKALTHLAVPASTVRTALDASTSKGASGR